jgi:prephenate dehydrogenase
MKKSISSDVLIIPTHPMFGPYIDNIASQVFVLTPDDKTKKDLRYQWLKNYLISKGAKVIETTPSYHDKIMSIVQ